MALKDALAETLREALPGVTEMEESVGGVFPPPEPEPPVLQEISNREKQKSKIVVVRRTEIPLSGASHWRFTRARPQWQESQASMCRDETKREKKQGMARLQ